MKLAIIGAGVAGLAAARTLRQSWPELSVTVYEKRAGVGGRVATSRRAGYAFDHGAQYLKTATPELLRLVTQELPAGELYDIAKPVWVFNGAGTIAEGDPAQNADPKWTYHSGLNLLSKLLAEQITVRNETEIAALKHHEADQQWALIDANGVTLDMVDYVLLTPPAPQTAALLAASDFDAGLKQALLAALAPVSYRRCISLAYAYERRIERQFYALVNTDRAHPISWLALEHDKGPQRCPPGHSLLLAQMAPPFSIEHWETPTEIVAPIVAHQISTLLGEALGEPLWCDRHDWQYALPDGRTDQAVLAHAGQGLFFAGDYAAGQGRVHLAIESGWQAARAVIGRVTE